MTLQDIKDAFEVDYRLEVAKRGLKEVKFNSGVTYRILAKAIKNVQRSLKINRNSGTISLVSGTSEYNLPSDFATPLWAKNAETILTKKNFDDIHDISESTGTPIYYATYVKDGTPTIKVNPTPSASSTLTIYYYQKELNYAPSSDSVSFSTTFPLPEDCMQAVVLHMLSELFEDKKIEYLIEIKSLRGDKLESISDQFEYNLAGGI